MNETEAQLLSRLKETPELLEHVSKLFDIIDNKDGKTSLANDAEEETIQQIRKLGHDVLQHWGESRKQSHEQDIASKGYRKKVKKNSIGKHD